VTKYNPLHIRAYLESPVIADKYLPIDGILHYQLMREAYGHQDYTVPGETPVTPEAGTSMPLARVNKHGPQWFFAASFAQWSHNVEGTDYWTKKFDSKLMDLLEGQKGKLNVSSGYYRGYHMPVFYRSAIHIDWYIVGLQSGIERLLSTCTHVGKKHAQGWGSVSRWIIEPCMEDWSVWCDGRLMRAIPADTGTLYGYRPSYWVQCNQALCRLPE
jgi:CRISPR type IV-associated protein Csf3